MVTRNRQRETENEPHHSQDGAIHRYRVADLASWQDKVYFHVTIPVVEPVPEPLAPKRPVGRPRVDPLKLNRAQKGTKQGTVKPDIGWNREPVPQRSSKNENGRHCTIAQRGNDLRVGDLMRYTQHCLPSVGE